MSYSLYENLGGLRFWTEPELRLRRRIAEALVDAARYTLKEINRAWEFQEVEAPLMMPLDLMSGSYDFKDVFMLQDAPGGVKQWALRPETTNGSYTIAKHILQTTNTKVPLCVWQMGPSFRRELSDGARAATLRFNQFTQLEMQMIYPQDTAFDIQMDLIESFIDTIAHSTGVDTRIVQSDRLPSYSSQTTDLECYWEDREWKEVASISRRNDFPTVPGYKPLKVLECAFGMDRLVAMTD